MDKLEPIIKHKFWIILGVGVILTFTGWWMATGSLAATIESRKNEISQAQQGIPTGSQLPNDDWSRQLAEINDKQEKMVSVVRRHMWKQQEAAMFWPDNMQEFVEAIPYRGDFGLVPRDLYRTSYQFSVEEVWNQVRPIQFDGTGIVLFPIEKMPVRSWGDLAPKSEEIWDAQEDLWLLVPLLQAIREVNGGENATRLDAAVHVIDKLELMGGERTQGSSSSGSGGSIDSGGAAGEDPMAMLGGLGSGRATEGGKAASADFNPEEEFGSSGREGGGGGGTFGGSLGFASASAEEAIDTGGSGGEVTGGTTVRRYVDDEESLPYKTRAFYLSVVMDHRKVPHLLGELTANGNSPWPIEIVRVQVARMNPDDTEGRSLNPGLAFNPMGAGSSTASEGAYTSEPAYETGSGGQFEGSGTPQAPLAGRLSMEAALQDPYVAKVALAGLIYIYKPVENDAQPSADPTTAEPTEDVMASQPAASDPATPEPAAAPVDGATEPATTTPENPGAPPAAGADAPAPADPAAAAPAGTPPAADNTSNPDPSAAPPQ